MASAQDSHPIPHPDQCPGPGPHEARLSEVVGRAEMTGLYQSPPLVVTSELERENSGPRPGCLGLSRGWEGAQTLPHPQQPWELRGTA